MRRSQVLLLSLWVFERVSRDPLRHVIAGDILEQCESGRTALWGCRQALFGVALDHTVRAVASSGLFSVLFSFLFPVWQKVLMAAVSDLPHDSVGLSWPISAAVPLGIGLFPALIFLWVSGLLYGALLHRGSIHSIQNQLPVLSAATLVLTLETLLLLTMHPGWKDLNDITRPDFYYPFHCTVCSLPLMISLFAVTFLAPTMQTARGTQSHLNC